MVFKEYMKYQDLSTFQVPDDFRGASKIKVQLWWLIQDTLFRLSPQVLYGWRRFLLRLFGAKIGKGVLIRSSARFTYPWKISIGDYCWIGDCCELYSLGNIDIGSNVAVAHSVYFNTGLHLYDRVSFDIASKPIKIEDQCWITNDVYIGPGVTIKEGAIVGARSSV
ncbi:MAG: WcaF family extracellular polysaccharide biosynthesis acetyltransferase, partial [Bacteroidales bacterium]|nr:WcaF family extracellular polysaccharide biosynthesis acetyltransferase [Bacteroidales bacterium]